MIKNKLIKYSNKPIPIAPLLNLNHILVSDIIENGEEWFLNLISFAKLTKKHFIVNVIPDEIMDKIKSEYDDFTKMEVQLTDAILGNLTQEERELLYKIRMELKVSRYSNIAESEFEDVSLLEMLFRSYIVEKYVYNTNHMGLLEKVIGSLKYLFKLDDVIIDEEDMVLVVYGNSDLGGKVDKIIIDGELFDEICENLLLITCEEKSKVESPKKFPNEEMRKRYEVVMAERERIERLKQKDNGMSQFEYVYNYVLNSDDERGDFDRISDYTVYQLMSRFYAIQHKEKYKENLSIYPHSSEPKKLDLVHWIEKIKKDNR